MIGSAAGLAAARAMRLPGSLIAAGPVPYAVRRALGIRHDLASLATLDAPAPGERGPDEDCAVLFTSGATGPAKGVVYTQRQALAQLELLRSTYGLTGSDRMVAAFAPFALLGPALGIGSAVPDIDVTAPGTLTAAALADAAAAVDATVAFASPAALRRVAATGDALTGPQRAALGRLRLLVSAGAPVPLALLTAVGSLVPAAEAHTPYGMTEALPVTDVSAAEIAAAGPGNGVCAGRPLAGVEVRVDPATREVCVRAAHVKDRYDALWATERASSRDPGWHRTGDVGHLDDAGRLWIEGRVQHVITTADGMVTPVGVEQRIETLDGVGSAAAVGVGPPGTQVVVAVVVPAGPAGGGRLTGRGLRPADPRLADAVRSAAGVDVAAVLTTDRLPVDIRHNSKIDRLAVARDAAHLLAGRTP